MFAGQTAGAAAHLAAKIFAAIESDQNPHIETLKVFHATVLPHLFKSVVEARVEQFGRRRIEQIANVIALSE
jgi:cyanophycinase-like exopeptidase